MRQWFGTPRGAGKPSYLLQLLSPYLSLGDTGESPGWAQVGFPEQLYQGVGRGWKQGDKGKVRLAPLTPKSLKVQTALMARLGSAHSGGKKEMRPWEADSTSTGFSSSC